MTSGDLTGMYFHVQARWVSGRRSVSLRPNLYNMKRNWRPPWLVVIDSLEAWWGGLV